MDATAAKARLTRMTAAASDPALSSDDLDDLVAYSARIDTLGRAPADTGWEGVYDLNAGAAEGWRWKAAACAERFDFADGTSQYSRAQLHAHCLEQVAAYQRKVVATIPATGQYRRYPTATDIPY